MLLNCISVKDKGNQYVSNVEDSPCVQKKEDKQ